MFLGISSRDSRALAITFRRPGTISGDCSTVRSRPPESTSRARTFDLLSPKSGLDVTAAKESWTGEGDQVAGPHKRNSLVRCLTPELSRAAARLGVVVQITA